MFADARMPIWGVSAILSNFLLAVLSREEALVLCASLLMLILFLISCSRFQTINRIQTERQKPEITSTMVGNYRRRGINR